MSRSIYSLVLDDELVHRIDVLANKQGKSRSAVVNELLARELSYETHEMHTRNVLGVVNDLLSVNDGFGIFMQDSSMMLRSVLSYRYNPTVRYSLEITGNGGLLRVSVRSKNELFMMTYESFLHTWYVLEEKMGRGDLSTYSDGRFSRELIALTNEPERTAEAMANYIQAFDNALKLYFSETGTSAAASVGHIYGDYIKKCGDILK